MKTISRHQIERLFPHDVYERGFKYFHEKRVHGLSYNRQKEEWFAEVYGTEPYYVDIGLNELQRGKVKAYCECPAFDTYQTCKHIVAVLLEIAEQRAESNHDLTNTFIENLISIPDSTVSEVISDKVPMKVEYYLYLDRKKIYLQLKTGIDHCYVIHQTRDFLQKVLADERYSFTKKFTFTPEEHYFLKQDIDIFKELYAFIQTGDLYTDRSYDINQAYDRRNILIPPLKFTYLLEKLSERKTFVIADDEHFDEFNIVQDEMPFSFSVIEENNRSILKVDHVTNAKLYFDYKIVFQQGTFYYLSDYQLEVAKSLKWVGFRDLELPIEPHLKNKFFSEALPILNRATEVEIDQKVKKNIVEYPLKAQLHLDQVEDEVVGNLIYRYGNFTINPFSQQSETDVVILRDFEKEQIIMHLIEQSNFHYNGKQLFIKMTDDEDLYDFLYEKLPLLEEYVELFVTDTINKMRFTEEPSLQTNIEVEESSNLLEVRFDMSGINEEEIASILQAVVEKKRYYRLTSGKILSLETDEMERVRNLFLDLRVNEADINTNKLKLSAYRGLQIEEWADGKAAYHDSFRQLVERLKQPERQIYPIPSNLRTTLRKYQETGYQWFKSLSAYQLGGILADDMGLGKTVQTIAYLSSERSEKPHLVVVPASVVYNWRNECRKFAPDLQVALLVGTREEREQTMEEAKSANVWITTYGLVRQDIDLYKEISFHSLILDEAQHVKNYFTKTSKAIREIQAEKKFALSGTPIENSLDELWAIFQVILPGFFPPLNEFRKMDRKKISTLTRPFILRRLKEDVLTELPEKIESVHISELTKEQKELYVGYLQQLRTETSSSLKNNRFQQERIKILAGLTRLRQICCHPSLFIENYTGRSGKLDELIELVQTFIENGRRMLIFSQFTSMHEIIAKELDHLGIEYFYLHGQTPAKERVQMSEAFNNGEKEVFLISLRAGGTGLNLTGADTVILFDLWWNPAVEDQATGRAHRFGQKNVVQVIRFITDGTIEEKIYELQQKKRELIDQVIQPGEKMISSLSEEDIRELLNI